MWITLVSLLYNDMNFTKVRWQLYCSLSTPPRCQPVSGCWYMSMSAMDLSMITTATSTTISPSTDSRITCNIVIIRVIRVIIIIVISAIKLSPGTRRGPRALGTLTASPPANAKSLRV